MNTYMYIELCEDASHVEKVIVDTDESTFAAKLKTYYQSMFEGSNPIDKSRTITELGRAVEYTYGWGENDIKLGHVLVITDKTFDQIW